MLGDEEGSIISDDNWKQPMGRTYSVSALLAVRSIGFLGVFGFEQLRRELLLF